MKSNSLAGRALLRPLLLGLWLPIFGVASPVRSALAADQDPAAPAAASPARRHHAPHRVEGSALEERVQALSKALALDARQQFELRAVLADQREQVRRIWDDSSLPAANRIAATQAISDRTADEIRALLNEEQRKKYNPPRVRPQDAAPRPDVAAWMEATGSRVTAPPPATH